MRSFSNNTLFAVLRGLFGASGNVKPMFRGSSHFAGLVKPNGSRVKHNFHTDWLHKAPHGGGMREVARRQRQIEAGKLKVTA